MTTVEQKVRDLKESIIAPDKVRSKLLWFLKAPCKPSQCPWKLKYRHFTCLTCPIRRYREQGTRSGYRQVKRVVVVLESASGKPLLLPKHYASYGLIIKTHPDGTIPAWKQIPIKILATIAERLAEW